MNRNKIINGEKIILKLLSEEDLLIQNNSIQNKKVLKIKFNILKSSS
jgi:hypothetical protein